MSPGLADAIGLFGSALMVIAYAYSNAAKEMNFTLFNLLNLVGAIMMITSLSVHFNLAAMLMEIIWAAVAAFGLAKAALRTRVAK